MKNITRLAMLAAVAAGFASCSIREMAAPEAPVNGIDVTVNASLGETKTVFGAPENGVIPVSWAAEGEAVELIEFVDGAASQAVKSTACTVENNGMNAKFQFTLAEKTGTALDYYAVYPAAAYRAGTAESLFGYAWAVDPQVPTPQGPDPAYCILVSKLPGQSAQPSDLKMAFEHVTTYVKFSLKNTPFAEGETVELFTVEIPGKDLAGRYNHFADSVGVYGTTNTSLVGISPEKLDTKSGSFDAWMACKPFAMKAGEKAYVKVKTQKRVITKEITAPADMDFAAGVANVLNLDMTTADAPRILEPNLTLSFDFSTARATLPDWPTAKGQTVEKVYTLDGKDYTFEIKDTYTITNQLTAEKGGYVRIPVIPGATIVSINGVTVKGKNSYACSITEDPEGTKVVNGGEKVVWTTAGDHIYVLSGTKAETPYYIYANGPLPINKLILNYYVEGETPAGPQPYEYPEVKGIEALTCFYWGETYGGASSKPMTGALNYKKLDDGSGIEFIEESHNYAVPGATISVPGCTFFEVCCSGATKLYDSYALIKGNTPEAPLPLYYSIPVKSAISGDLEFCCCINQGTNPTMLSKVTFAWSTDKTNWKDFDAVYSKPNCSPEAAAGKTGFETVSNNASLNWAVCCFSIPEAEAIPAGGTFYVRATPEFTSSMTATSTLRANGGFMLVSKVVNTDFSASSNVIASRNFDDCWGGFQGMIGKPTRYFVSSYGNGADNKFDADVADAYGWTPCGTFVQRRGYVWAQDNAAVAAYFQSPALSALTEPTDVMVTFKCCVFVDPLENVHPDNFGVSVEGPGEVQELQKDSPAVPEGATHLSPEAYQWHRYYALIKGATAETKVNVGKLSAVSASRFYLDDIVITK